MCRARDYLREYGCRRRLILWQTNFRRLSVIPLECHVGRPHTESPRGYLLEIVVTSLDPELHRVERILDAHCDAHVVTIELLAKREGRHLHSREPSFLDLHRRAIEVKRLENYRRVHLRSGVEPIRPGNGVRRQRRLRATVRHHLEDIESAEGVELGTKPEVAVQIAAPGIALVEVLEAHRSHFAIVHRVSCVDVDTNDIRRAAIKRRKLDRAELS